MASLTQELKGEKSPLQQELEKVTKIVTILSVTMGVGFFFLGTYIGKLNVAAAFVFAIGIIVANVPEGLLPTVSLSLAMAVQRMARRNALIKRLSSVETLGCTTVICTDKTGTLTTNEISVTKIFVNGKIIHVSGTRYEPAGSFYFKGISLSRREMMENGMDTPFLTRVCFAIMRACFLPGQRGKDGVSLAILLKRPCSLWQPKVEWILRRGGTPCRGLVSFHLRR
ncbi:MAG: HAD-IC family P-type ATPase [Candidatus Brocadia sinica]|nr:HAD-IC family P-type ATPase [Candidatus Brocadia sinica]